MTVETRAPPESCFLADVVVSATAPGGGSLAWTCVLRRGDLQTLAAATDRGIASYLCAWRSDECRWVALALPAGAIVAIVPRQWPTSIPDPDVAAVMGEFGIDLEGAE